MGTYIESLNAKSVNMNAQCNLVHMPNELTVAGHTFEACCPPNMTLGLTGLGLGDTGRLSLKCLPTQSVNNADDHHQISLPGRRNHPQFCDPWPIHSATKTCLAPF
jgi:hypothetical protein